MSTINYPLVELTPTGVDGFSIPEANDGYLYIVPGVGAYVKALAPDSVMYWKSLNPFHRQAKVHEITSVSGMIGVMRIDLKELESFMAKHVKPILKDYS